MIIAVCCAPDSPGLLVCMLSLLDTPALLPLSSFSLGLPRLPESKGFFFSRKLDQQKITMTDSNSTVCSGVKLCISITFYVYLNFSEDKFVPDSVPSGNTLVQLCYFSAESQMQQPFFQRPVSLTKYLQRYETSLYSGWQQGKKQGKFESRAQVHWGQTFSHMRLSKRGTIGKTVGFSVCKSSIKSRISPWKNPIRAPWMRMTPWKKAMKHFVQKMAYNNNLSTILPQMC